MAFRKRTLIYLFLVLDLILLNTSILLTSLWHYKAIVTDNVSLNILFTILNVNWIITYVYGLNDRFFDYENIINRTKELLKKIAFYVCLSALVIVVLNKDELSRAMLQHLFPGA
jgi:hypothetical protein